MNYQEAVNDAVVNACFSKCNERILVIKRDMERVIRSNILTAFFEAIPEHNIKLDIKTIVQSKVQNKMIVPFNAFFYPYTIDVENDCVETFEPMGNHATVTKMKTVYGDFWFVAIAAENTNSVHVKNDKDIYADGISRLSLQCSLHSGGVRDNSVIIFARIDPCICANCNRHNPEMRKCKGCWDNLKICVRYCNKECQKEDYKNRHRYYCGCKHGVEQSVRDGEFESRSDSCKNMTLRCAKC